MAKARGLREDEVRRLVAREHARAGSSASWASRASMCCELNLALDATEDARRR